MTFEVIPAIDLRDGKCVRLQQGDFARETVYSDDPAETARRWIAAGCSRIHVVDLDGARHGVRANLGAVYAIAAAARSAGVAVQASGGIRTLDDVRATLDAGADRAIVGTAALQTPSFLYEATAAAPGAVALGIDVKAGRPAVRGWLDSAALTLEESFALARDARVAAVIVTDIAHDGVFTGPNLDLVRHAITATGVPVIASGGVATIAHLCESCAAGAAGAITGKALYDGRIDLAAAIAAVRAC